MSAAIDEPFRVCRRALASEGLKGGGRRGKCGDRVRGQV